MNSEDDVEKIRKSALENHINFRYFDETAVGISLAESTTLKDVEQILKIYANSLGKSYNDKNLPTVVNVEYPELLKRKSALLCV